MHFCFSKHVKELLWLHKKSENKGLNQLHRCLETAWMGWILGVAQLHSGHSCARLSRGSDVMYNGSPQGCRNRGMEGRVRWGEVRGGWNQILALRFCCAPQTTGRGLMWSHLLQVLHIWYCPANGDRRGKKNWVCCCWISLQFACSKWQLNWSKWSVHANVWVQGKGRKKADSYGDLIPHDISWLG